MLTCWESLLGEGKTHRPLKTRYSASLADPDRPLKTRYLALLADPDTLLGSRAERLAPNVYPTVHSLDWLEEAFLVSALGPGCSSGKVGAIYSRKGGCRESMAS